MIPEHVWADDLTGAAEIADLLAARTGLSVTLVLTDGATVDADIVVHDLDLRHARRGEARAALSERLRRTQPSERVFLKLDSQLHGPVAGLLGAMVDGGRTTVLSAANPAIGRVTVGGVHRVFGPEGERSTALGDLLEEVPHRIVSHGSMALGTAPAVLAADAQDEGDLKALASIAIEHGLDAAGSAALLAAMLGAGRTETSLAGPPPEQLVAVVGSIEPAAHAQLDAAAAHRAIEVVEAHPRQIPEGIEAARAALAEGRHVAIARSTALDGLAALAEVAASVLAGCEPGRTATLLTGGHTARLVLDRLGVAALTAAPDRPGAIVRMRAPSGLTVFTKPGSYGAPDALTELLTTLRPVHDEEYR